MATKKRKSSGGNGNGSHDDAVVSELRRIYEEIRAQGARQETLTAEVRSQGGKLDAVTTRLDRLTDEVRAQGKQLTELTQEVRANGVEMRAVRELLVTAVATDRRRIDSLEGRVSALEAGKH